MGYVRVYTRKGGKGKEVGESFTAVARYKGISRSKTFPKQRDAERWWPVEEARIKEELESGRIDASSGRVTVRQLLEDFERKEFHRLEARGWECYLKAAKQLLGNQLARDLSPALIEQALEKYEYKEDGAANPANGKYSEGELAKRAPSSVNKLLTLLSLVCKRAYKLGYIPRNPCRDVERRSELGSAKKFTLHDEATVRLIEEAKKSGWPALVTLIQVAMHTGYRREVVSSLRIDQIDFERGVISVSSREEAIGKRGKPRKKSTSITTELERLLKEHIANLRAAGLESPFLFPSQSDPNKPWNNFNSYFRAVKRAGLEGVNFHSLRHFHGHQLGKADVPIQVIAKSLGHTNLQTTLRYVHTADEQVAETTERVFGKKNLEQLTKEHENKGDE